MGDIRNLPWLHPAAGYFVPMDATLPTPVPPAYKDRRTGLLAFGILAILVGVVFALFVPLALIVQVMVAKNLGTQFDVYATVAVCLVYSLTATGMIWLGVGSILARRWARALLLCLASIALIIGLLVLPTAFGMMGSIGDLLVLQDPLVSPARVAAIKWGLRAISFVIYVVIPGSAVLFYRSPHVKQTCEVRDPTVRWTDRCPLPVLALVLLQAGCGLLLLLLFPIYGGTFPVAGYMISGGAAWLVWLVVIGFMAYAARGFYRLDRQAWLVYLVGSAALWASLLLTFLQDGLATPFQSGSLLTMSVVVMGLFLGYLLYVRRYFPAITNRPAAVAG
jgi:hypothetical protein